MLTSSRHPWPHDLSRLLRLRLRDPEKLDRLHSVAGTEIGAAHAAFVQGDDAAARRGYLRCVASGNQDAWIGLLLLRRRLAGLTADSPLIEQPEVIAAVYERVRALTDVAADPEALVEWLAGEAEL